METKIINDIRGGAVLEITINGQRFYTPVSKTSRDASRQEMSGDIDMKGKRILNAGSVEADEVKSGDNSVWIGKIRVSLNRLTRRLRINDSAGKQYKVGILDELADDPNPTLTATLNADGNEITNASSIGTQELNMLASAATAKSAYLLGKTVSGNSPVEYIGAESPVVVEGGLIKVLDLNKTGWDFNYLSSVTMSFTDLSRKFTISSVGTSFHFWVNGIKYTKTTDSVTITDTEGLWFIYFNSSGVLTASQTPWSITDNNAAFVSIVYWDADNNKHIRLGNELHTWGMDAETHNRLHSAGRSAYSQGLGLTNMTTGGDGSLDAHAKLGIDNGSFFDEDIKITITDGSPQDISTVATMPVFYRSGITAWRMATPTAFPFSVGATPLPYYNLNTAGTWSLSQVTSGNFAMYHIYATNDIEYPMISIMGQAEYTTLANARAGATTELKSLNLGLLDTLAAEFIPVATIIVEGKTSFTNSVNARIVKVDSTNDYIDWRGTQVAAGAPSVSVQAFPIGSVFISVVSTDPATLLGYGVWAAFGAGKVLVGLDSGDVDFDTVEEPGGTKTVKSEGIVENEKSHTHSVTTNVTVANHSAHTHAVSGAPSATTIVQSGTGATVASSTHGHSNTGNPSATLSHSVTNGAVTSGAGSSHGHTFTGSTTSVVQPYIVVYMWKRTS